MQRIHPDNDLIRLKNWLTVDPRKLRGIRRFVIRPHRKVVYGPDREAILNDLYSRPEAFPTETGRDDATDSGLVPLGPPEPISPELLPGLDVAQPVREASMPGVAALAVDTLATSVVLMLAMTVLQRLIGFARGIAFCRMLDPEQLGQWDVAFGFINLAAPLAVLGLPGSFGRYFEYYRQRGQVRMFLKRHDRTVSGQRAGGGDGGRPGPQLVFGVDLRPLDRGDVGAVADRLPGRGAVVQLFVMHLHGGADVSRGHGDAVLAKRRFRGGQPGFVPGLAAHRGQRRGRLWFGVGGLHARLLSLLQTNLAEHGRRIASRRAAASFWLKLMPFAAWLWVSNLLSGLFELIDRYMIVHFSGLHVDEALRQVGYYHTSRLLPLLFVAVSALLGSMITPHLSHDWEQGKRRAVANRLNTVLKTLDLSLFAASLVALVCATFLFNTILGGRFAGGLEELPLTLVYCTWFGTVAVAQNYLWCARRPG